MCFGGGILVIEFEGGRYNWFFGVKFWRLIELSEFG